jgi:DNA polymerase I-like protein with 3'-5' exonuclease and polymerase domains
VTKQAMVNYDELGAFADENPMILQVHDELLVGANAPGREVHEKLKAAMADVDDIEIPMLSDGKFGRVSWDKLKKVKW